MRRYILGILSLVALALGVTLVHAPVSQASAPVCTNPAKGVLQDWYGGTNTYLVTYNMNTIQIKNTSTDCAYKVGIASYKAYEPYTVNVFSQKYYASHTTILQPGQKWTATVAIPACTYQTDVYWGNTIFQFTKPNGTYSGQGRFLDGWYFPGNASQQGKLPVCAHSTPTPKPTCPPGTQPDGDKCGEVMSATHTPTPTPPHELPSTGPGLVGLLALAAPLGALLTKKYIQ